MDPDPAKHGARFEGPEGSASEEAGGGTARLPALAGGGVEVLACIVPGREPCFFLPGTPRWRPGARGLSRRMTHGPKNKAVRYRVEELQPRRPAS